MNSEVCLPSRGRAGERNTLAGGMVNEVTEVSKTWEVKADIVHIAASK